MIANKISPFVKVLNWVLIAMILVSGLSAALATFMGVWFFSQTSTERHLVNAVITIAFVAVAILLALLRKLVLSSGNDPYSPENARRLRMMGLIAILWQASDLLLAFSGHGVNLVSVPGFRLRLVEENTLSVSGLVMTCCLFVLAHVFARGAEMREELEGTV